MSQIGTIFPRSTLQGSSDRLLASLRRTQSALADAQLAISSGQTVTKPSDDSARSSVILLLENQLQARSQHERNLQHGISVLNFVDQSLSDTTNTIIGGRDIASSQIGVGSNAATRASESAVVDVMIQGLMDVANRQFQGLSLFGGNHGETMDQPMFEAFLGGVRYRGASVNLKSEAGLNLPISINSNGDEAFAALSSRMLGDVDLNPQLTVATRIVDVRGAQIQGVRLGSVIVTVDGTPTTVDLTTSDNLGDVLIRVVDAITHVDSTAGFLGMGGSGFLLNANPGHTISIAEIGAGQTATDLGINLTATGSTLRGQDINPHLTELTELTALGAAVDLTSGLKITQGAQTKIVDFAAASTIQDMMIQIDQLNLGLRLQINQGGTGLNLVSEVSGLELSIGENAGGTTATDLGLRSLSLSTQLGDFRFGLGVEAQPGVDDFAIELHDGRTFAVNLDGASTVDKVITSIQTAAGSTMPPLVIGSIGNMGTDFNVGLALDGNGIQFEDNTIGSGDFRVAHVGISLAASHLGIYQNAGAGSTIRGDDMAKVRVESIFTHLGNLRDALANDDSAGITLAGDAIGNDSNTVAQVRAEVGVRTRQFEQQHRQSGELKNTELTMLSNLQDADFTEVITNLLQLQQQLQASLRVGAQDLQLSFLDFLR